MHEFEALVGDPLIGLQVQIKGAQLALKKNVEAQTFETKARNEATLEYKANIGRLIQATKLVENAISVLSKYYAQLGKYSLVQVQLEGVVPPLSWDEKYRGQSEQSVSAIQQLESIVKRNSAEKASSDADEKKAQIAYEDSIAKLKKEHTTVSETLARLRKQLAEAEQVLLEKTEDKNGIVASREAIKAYHKKLKPRCDLITAEIDARTASRHAEVEALKKAVDLLKATPAYHAAEVVAPAFI